MHADSNSALMTVWTASEREGHDESGAAPPKCSSRLRTLRTLRRGGQSRTPAAVPPYKLLADN